MMHVIAIMQKIRMFSWGVPEKMSQNPNFWHLIPLNPQIKIFFQIRVVSLLLLYGPATSCKVSEKTNKRSLRYLKTDTRTHGRTHRPQGWLLRTPPGKPRIQPTLRYASEWSNSNSICMKNLNLVRTVLIHLLIRHSFEYLNLSILSSIHYLFQTWILHSWTMFKRIFFPVNGFYLHKVEAMKGKELSSH